VNLKSLIFEPLKIKANSENILFWGCLHHNHDPKWPVPIWKTRGYNSAAECDAALIQNWNNKANSETIGFLLGDTVFGDPTGEKLTELMENLSFKTMFICAGNHFSGFKQILQNIEGNEWVLGDKTIIFCPNYFEAFVNGQAVTLSHYPILSWNGQAKGSFSLFSHVHDNLERSAVGAAYSNSGARSLEVSVEKFNSPPNFKEISDILLARKPISFDHHDSRTNNPF